MHEDDLFYSASSSFTKIWAACLILPESLAVVATVFRLRLRQKKGLFWWDDVFAFAALITALPVFVNTYVLMTNAQFSGSVNRYFGFMVLISFYTAAWLTRVSWTLSIARTKPHGSFAYRSLLPFACLLLLLWASNLGLMIDSCSKDKAWYSEYPYLCLPSPPVTLFAFISSILADFTLVLVALKLYWDVNFTRTIRRLVLIGFTARSAMIPTTLAAVINTRVRQLSKYNLVTNQYLIVHCGLLCCLFGCNALVVITFAYQQLRRDDSESNMQISSLSRMPSSCSTSVELADSKTVGTRSTPPSSRQRATHYDADVRHLRSTVSGALTDVSMHFSDFSFSQRS